MPSKKKKGKVQEKTPAEICSEEIKAVMTTFITLPMCSYLGDMEGLKMLKEQSDEKEFKAMLNQHNVEGRTPLALTARGGHIEAMKFLIDLKADINATSYGGRAPLHFAASEGKLEMVEYINSLGASTSVQDLAGNTPLMLSAKRGHLKVTEYLAAIPNIEIDQRNEAKRTALMSAVQTSNLGIIDVLVHKGADVMVTDANGETALHMAARCGYDRVAKKLLLLNADLNHTTREGKTALDMAQEGSAVFNILEKASARVAQ